MDAKSMGPADNLREFAGLTRKLLWTLDIGDTNWDHTDQLMEKTRNTNYKHVTI